MALDGYIGACSDNDKLNALGLQLLMNGDVKAFNKLREDNPDYTPDLSGVDSLHYLNEVNLSMANLEGARLRGAQLRGEGGCVIYRDPFND